MATEAERDLTGQLMRRIALSAINDPDDARDGLLRQVNATTPKLFVDSTAHSVRVQFTALDGFCGLGKMRPVTITVGHPAATNVVSSVIINGAGGSVVAKWLGAATTFSICKVQPNADTGLVDVTIDLLAADPGATIHVGYLGRESDVVGLPTL